MDNLATSPAERLAARLEAGETAALARAITAVENAVPGANALLSHLRPITGRALSIGITGPPGAGKSTLINALVSAVRRSGRRVAVLAVDPSSPLTGGAVLGDRTRMGEHTNDPGVFIRSLPSRGHLGGLSAAIYDIVDLIDAAKWDVMIIETVGAGQTETDIAGIADVRLVVAAPGLGDDIQALKAGILEIADILVVNKADRDGADATVRQLEGMLAMRTASEAAVSVLKTVATTGEGIAELLQEIDGQGQEGDTEWHRQRRSDSLRGVIAANAGEFVRRAIFEQSAPFLNQQIEDVVSGRRSVRDVVPDAIRSVLPDRPT